MRTKPEISRAAFLNDLHPARQQTIPGCIVSKCAIAETGQAAVSADPECARAILINGGNATISETVLRAVDGESPIFVQVEAPVVGADPEITVTILIDCGQEIAGETVAGAQTGQASVL